MNEDATGLIYMRGRYYSPLWHRFVNSDQGADARSANQYAYVGGMPFAATDPSGMTMTGTLVMYMYALEDYLRWYYNSLPTFIGPTIVLTADPPTPIDLWSGYNPPGNYGGGGYGGGGAGSAAEPLPTEKDVPCEVRYAIMDAVDASNRSNATDRRGGFHEEGGIWGVGPDGNTLISPAVPGAPWKKGNPQIFIDQYDSVDPSIKRNMADILGKYHVHPRGGGGWDPAQPPSKGDFANADPMINIVAGASNGTIYFYNNEKTLNNMSFKDFMKGCQKI